MDQILIWITCRLRYGVLYRYKYTIFVFLVFYIRIRRALLSKNQLFCKIRRKFIVSQNSVILDFSERSFRSLQLWCFVFSKKLSFRGSKRVNSDLVRLWGKYFLTYLYFRKSFDTLIFEFRIRYKNSVSNCIGNKIRESFETQSLRFRTCS